MNPTAPGELSKREQQVMDVLFRLGRASAQEVMEAIPSPPSYSAVRALLTILEDKGYLKHGKEGRRYIYSPTVSPDRAKRNALRSLLQTFYDNSAANLVASLLDPRDQKLSKSEIERIRGLIDGGDETSVTAEKGGS